MLTESKGSVKGTLSVALGYRDRGWSVIPLTPRSKTPAAAWKDYQRAIADEHEVRRWFEDDTYNLGVVCGDVSQGLAVRDFDAPDSYANWAAAHANLAKSIPTVRTGRPGGHHLYFNLPDDALRTVRAQRSISGQGAVKLDDGELRADIGCYVAAPPSVHPLGTVYTWSIRPGDRLPIIYDLEDSGLLDCWTRDALVQRDRVTASVHSVHSALSVQEVNERIEEAVAATQPSDVGQRRNCIWLFARMVAGIPGVTPADEDRAIRMWHQLALPVIGTKSFDATRFDFMDARESVRFPLGDGGDIVASALLAADSRPLPECASRYEDAELRRLVGLCAELQRGHGDAPFFLSCRVAGRVLGIGHADASRDLRGLCRDGVLREVERPPRGTGRAIRYRFVGMTGQDQGHGPQEGRS